MWVFALTFFKIKMKMEIEKLIGDKKIAVIKKLYDLCPNMAITGSICLNYYCVVDRPIKDIDVVVTLAQFKAIAPYIIDLKISAESEPIDEKDKNTQNNFRLEMDNCDICVFLAEDNTNFHETKLGETNVRICHPRYAIEAKRKYVNQIKETNSEYRQKHLSDIEAYEKWMGSFL